MENFAKLADGVPDSTYAPLIAKAAGDLPQLATLMREIHEAWISGRIDKVEAILPRTLLGQSPPVKTVVLNARNANWMPIILETLRSEKRTLIAVAHSIYPNQAGCWRCSPRLAMNCATCPSIDRCALLKMQRVRTVCNSRLKAVGRPARSPSQEHRRRIHGFFAEAHA
jgi:hypothetical protein